MSGSISPVSATNPARPLVAASGSASASSATASSSSGSSSSSSDTTSVTTNADGSVTTTVSDAKGNIVSVSTVPAGDSSNDPGSRLSLQA